MAISGTIVSTFYVINTMISKKIEGVIYCSSTIGDADLETNRMLKKYINMYGDTQID